MLPQADTGGGGGGGSREGSTCQGSCLYFSLGNLVGNRSWDHKHIREASLFLLCGESEWRICKKSCSVRPLKIMLCLQFFFFTNLQTNHSCKYLTVTSKKYTFKDLVITLLTLFLVFSVAF